MLTFQKAVKHDAKLRLAICGPAGSGKTYSLLSLATSLGGPVALVDTEHGSASKYADLFDFDTVEPDTYDPRQLIDLIKGAESTHRVICVDSLSHYWMGKGGELEMVDAAAKRIQGNSFAAWKHVTPVHNELVDTIIGAKIHVLVSMRSKTEWVIEEDSRGKKTPRKIGLAPVMRDGIEFEFDVCGDIDQDNTLTVTKSRCPDLSGKVIHRPGKDMAITLKKWLTGAPVAPRPVTPVLPPAPAPAPAAQPASMPPPAAPREPFRASDDDLPQVLQGAKEPPPPVIPGDGTDDRPWTTFREMLERFSKAKDAVGDEAYYRCLRVSGVEHANAWPKTQDGQKSARNCYAELVGIQQAMQQNEEPKQ